MSWVDLSVLVLATMVAVLAGMVGYMYWQQNRVLQAVSSLSSFVASQFVKAAEPEPEDDRESVEEAPAEVKEEVEIVEDVDDLQAKTTVELRELLSKKGLPYGKRDSKSVLLQLLKASA
jgi:predicted negative regulator of RcsB-dependent stress response